MPKLEERKTKKHPLKAQSSDKCEICGKQVQEKFNSENVLCREHASSRGDIWVLNMTSWQWYLEKRGPRLLTQQEKRADLFIYGKAPGRIAGA